MKIRIAVSMLVVLLVIFCYPSLGTVFCADAGNSSNTQSALYSYDESNPPEVFFFPKEKARWDGNKVTLREWYMLTELQKEKFISEYIGQMRKQYDGAIDVMGFDYLRALNLFSYYSNQSHANEPSVKVIDTLLKGQGKITKEPN